MIFISLQYIAFFIAVLLILLTVRGQQYRKYVILVASYYFYAYWDYRFTLLLIAATLIDFWIGKALYCTTVLNHRRLLLITSVIVNLGVLGFFKYYNFFIDTVSKVVSSWGINIHHLQIILPLGISFYTFETMSYIIDIYRGTLQPAKSFTDFALFITFFPHLIAGPIVRAADFLPQLQRPIRIERANVWAGFQIFVIGLFKKLMIADAVAPFVDQVYTVPGYYSSYTVWLAIFAYALQIYGDFSGYTDMAIGCARILGFHLKPNFNMPYLSQNVTEFWQRWHISLSSWLRDYLYISLGGSRKGEIRTYSNLMITMLLGGLWHGASWNFVVWGALHGMALVIHRLWSKHFQLNNAITRATSIFITFFFVTLLWVPFRAADSETALAVFRKLLFIDSAGATWYYTAVFMATLWMVIGHSIGFRRQATELVFFSTPYSYRAALGMVTILLFIYLFAPFYANPFIYFQF